MRPNDVEDAALPERGHRLRTSPPLGPAHGDGNGLRCPEVGNAGRFDAKRRSVVPVRWVAWPKSRRMCGGSLQISRESGGFLADTNYVFMPEEWANRAFTLMVGRYQDWIEPRLSDHVPLVLEITTPP